jgi:hypothetical protein
VRQVDTPRLHAFAIPEAGEPEASRRETMESWRSSYVREELGLAVEHGVAPPVAAEPSEQALHNPTDAARQKAEASSADAERSRSAAQETRAVLMELREARDEVRRLADQSRRAGPSG